MLLNSIQILNYKNIIEQKLFFDKKINCFIGNNGAGKSNILDSIYHLCLGKSYLNNNSTQNINFNKDFFMLEGDFLRSEKKEKVNCSFKKGKKKILKRNGKIYKKISDHIGYFPLIMISPYDRDLISEGSFYRRRFIDGIISQINPSYLKNLITYNKLILQRNTLLKNFSNSNRFDLETLKIYDQQIESVGIPIYETRKKFLKNFISFFKIQYKLLSHSDEEISIDYKSQLNESDYTSLFKNNLENDRYSNYTNCGIHKDDLIFKIHGKSIKKFGSQGQQKTFVIALKIAQFDFIKKNNKFHPIILFDDIFDKLDQIKVELIMSLIEDEKFGQVFITDTHYDRTSSAIKKTKSTFKIFELPFNE